MYKILSIDGGGIKGIAPASLLANIEERTGKKIIDYFDLIVGTSTGGIIALGLGLGFSARKYCHCTLIMEIKFLRNSFFSNLYLEFALQSMIPPHCKDFWKKNLRENF